jgi:hypothetical protein
LLLGGGHGGLGFSALGGLLGVDNLDVVVAEHRHHVVNLVRGDNVRGQRVVHLVVGEEALLTADLEKVLHLLAVGDGLLFHLVGGGIRVNFDRSGQLIGLFLRVDVFRQTALALGCRGVLGLCLGGREQQLLALQLLLADGGGLGLGLRLMGGVLGRGLLLGHTRRALG